MALSESLPYGLRDVKITPITPGTNAFGTPVDLPNSRTFSFKEAEDFETLEGDDKTVATRGKGASVEFDLESGGISLECYVILVGGTLVVSGTTPNQKKVYSKLATDARPEFKVEGQAMSESGGDMHCMLPRCKVTDSLEGEFGIGAFFLSKCSGTSLPGKTTGQVDKIYEFTQNETAVTIPTT